MGANRDALQRYSLAVISHLLLVLAWYLFVELGHVPKFVMPSPVETLDALLAPNYGWWSNIAVTATEIFGGYFLALILVPLIVALIGMAIERLFLRPIYRLDHMYGLLLTFGIQGVMLIIAWPFVGSAGPDLRRGRLFGYQYIAGVERDRCKQVGTGLAVQV